MELTILGTSGMLPTKERNVSATFLQFKAEGILFDCGEGTQRQMNLCGINRNAVTRILISHWHADHALGIVGLLQTVSNQEMGGSAVTVVGPKGTKQRMEHIQAAFPHDSGLNIKIIECDPNGIELCIDAEEFQILAANLEHSTPCIGFTFVEKDRRKINTEVLRKLGIPDGPHLRKLQDGKSMEYKGKTITPEQATVLVPGKRIAYVTDTRFCDSAIKLAQDADLLICEATYADDLEDKAHEYKHMTAAHAGKVANLAGVKQLILTHFSQRYKNTQQIEDDVRRVFDNARCANDFERITL